MSRLAKNKEDLSAEAGLQLAMPVHKQVEAMVYSEVSASKKPKTIDDYFN